MLTVAFDVDDTLVTYEYQRDEPNRPLINVLIWFHMQGHHVIVWSGGGKDYAEMWARRLMIDGMVECREKPRFMLSKDTGELPLLTRDRASVDICFDDREVFWGKVNIRVRNMGGMSTHDGIRGIKDI